ncbi:MAG: hypothetical protein UDG86_04175 [Lachnospiraceae bacterium]|jgi:hypothetical protein|nr:hypothetical protein [Lachnospiraceae bacterium]
MKREFVENMIKAKKYEAQAFASLFPESVKPHIQVIQKELSEMVKECLFSGSKHDDKNTGEQNSRVNKIKID